MKKNLKAKGRTQDYIDHVASHKVYKGNRPTNTLLLKQISPRSIGALIAIYEHKIFCQGILLGIGSFDQWGVELGKELAVNLENELKSGLPNHKHDSSTKILVEYYRTHSR